MALNSAEMSASGILRRGRDTRKRDFCLVAGELLRDRDRGEGRERLGSEARSDDPDNRVNVA